MSYKSRHIWDQNTDTGIILVFVWCVFGTFHMMPRHSGEAVRLAARWNAGRRTLAKLLASFAGHRFINDEDSFCISRTMQWHRLLLLLSLPSDDVVVIGNRALAVVQARELQAVDSNNSHIASMPLTLHKPILQYLFYQLALPELWPATMATATHVVTCYVSRWLS